MKRVKVGRNERCPCGSGKKYKKCHLNMPNSFSFNRDGQTFQQTEVREHQRKKQQGLGREIISTDFQGLKIVAVGDRIHYSERWRTFHDFLKDYLGETLDIDWCKQELEKAFQDRHPVVQWFGYYVDYLRKNTRPAVNGVLHTNSTTHCLLTSKNKSMGSCLN